MIIHNQPGFSALIIPFSGRLDLDELAQLKASWPTVHGRHLVVVLDCAAVGVFDEETLMDLLALRRCIERLGVGKIMLAIRHRTRQGAVITRLIPASPRIQMVQLLRYGMRGPIAA